MNRHVQSGAARPRHTIAEAVSGTPLDASPEARALDELHARILGSGDGAKLLAYFRAITIGRLLGADASDGALREAEATRRFVAQIELRIARHHEIATRPDPGTAKA